jgi:hypothetical protein
MDVRAIGANALARSTSATRAEYVRLEGVPRMRMLSPSDIPSDIPLDWP